MSSKFTRKKVNGGIEALVKRVKTPGTVDVGIIDAGQHASGDATVAQIGMWNEFGTERIPERSFFRSTVQEEEKHIVSLQRKLLKSISDGKITTDKALALLGEFLSDKIRRKIVALNEPPNAPSTIKAKGSSNPLVDTGQLKNSVTYEVNR